MVQNAIKIGILVLVSSALTLNAGFASEKKSFVVGVQDFREYLPYSEYVNGEYRGFNRELLDLFARSNGYVFKYKAFPIKRLYRVFLNTDVLDLKYPDNPYWSRNLKKDMAVTYSDPVVEYIDGVMIHPTNKGKGIAHLKVLGVVAGFTPVAYLEYIENREIQVREIYDYRNLLVQAIHKRIDGVYSNIMVSRYYLYKENLKIDALVFDPELPYTKSYRHLSSIHHPEIIEAFNAFLIHDTETIEKLKKKYMVEDLPQQ